jgi:CubicO group peptidase (beta-lactamase class C family)
LRPSTVSAQTHAEATTVQFPGLDGVLPGYGVQRPNDWGLGFEIKSGKSPHWTGAANSPRTYGHFGQSGTFIWVDPAADLALVVLTDRAFGEWSLPLWPALSDRILAEFAAD